ncbi:MAG TPA: outer membrane beta-barrel protein [Azospirillaceae bacterium]|nr:outer membrane beta-barrel protein [Azospirillaceae bacterium]
MSRPLLALLLAAPVAAGASAAHARSAFDGFYAGASVAMTDLKGPATSTLAGSTSTQRLNGDGHAFGAYTGFGWSLGPAYLGAEANAELDNARADTIAGVSTIRIGTEESYGIGGRAGISLSDYVADVLLYGKASRQWTDLKIAQTLASSSLGNETSNATAWRYGGGVEVAFSSDMWVRLEYTRTNYDPITVATGTLTSSADLRTDQYRIGIAFRFF